MKSKPYLLAILLILVSCSKDEDLLKQGILDKPSEINVFCQKKPNDLLRSVAYQYEHNNLITETIFYNGDIQDKTAFEYNYDNQLIFETTHSYLRKSEKSYIYNELNQLINIKYKFTDYDISGQSTGVTEMEAPREYQSNQLVKQWEAWGGFITYEYSEGKLITKVEYTKNEEKHHTTTYTYSGDYLIEEKKETSAGALIYLRSFTYDSEYRLLQIREGENIIEENDYSDRKLIEKRTFYFGVDPGYDVCYGNYIKKYVY